MSSVTFPTPVPIHQEAPSTQFLLLRKIIESTSNPQTFNGLVEAGFAPDQLKTLATLPVSQLSKLCQLLEFEIEFFIEPAVLERCLATVLGKNDELHSYFLKHGAPLQLLKTLFGLSKAEINNLRLQATSESKSAMNLLPTPGRPKMPPESVRTDIERDWLILEESAVNLADRYFKLHQKFPQYTIAALHTVLMESI